MERRTYLAAIAAVGGATGCVGQGPGDDATGGDGPNSPIPEPSSSPSPTPTPSPSPNPMQNGITETSFKVIDSECKAGEDTASVERSDGEVTIRGTIIGFNSCYTAELGSATYDEPADELAVVIHAFEPDVDASCLSCELLIDYRATIEFEGDAPKHVTISHDDRSVEPA